MKQRFLQANKEAKMSLYLTFFYLFLWIIFAYVPDAETMFLGLPLWFTFSCIITALVFILTCYLVIKFFFKNISLEYDDKDLKN